MIQDISIKEEGEFSESAEERRSLEKKPKENLNDHLRQSEDGSIDD
jgi:hypothetical protein